MISDKIMVIDDDHRVISSVKLVFKEYEVVGFEKGDEALAYLKKPNEINLVLLDVFMRGLDGLSLLSEIRKINKTIPVIIMTAFGSMDIAVEALRNRADDFIEKPFDIIVLREKIKALLKARTDGNKLMVYSTNKVERIKGFIERANANISLGEIADEICLSTKYVGRLFNKENGEGFREYKLSVKLKMAKTMLKNSSLLVKEISDKLGYQNPETFMRIFKRKIKLTPTEFREKNGRKHGS